MRLAGEGEHGALPVEQVELGVGLEQHEVAQEVDEFVRMALVQIEDVGVHRDDAAEEGIGPVVGRLVLEALECEQHGRDDAQRGQGTGDEDRQGDLEADGHGPVTGSLPQFAAVTPTKVGVHVLPIAELRRGSRLSPG